MHDEPEWPGDAPAEGRGQDSIGSIFERTRRELGYDLDTVAAELRIRRPYLEAIEEGRYDDLPGTPYAIGFVRSYADYLGLDSDTSVALYKAEVSELARTRQELNFPAPKPEGRLPGFALVLISLLVVALAYGAWYYWTESDRPFVELLPQPEEEDSPQLAEEQPGEGQTAGGQGTDGQVTVGQGRDGQTFDGQMAEEPTPSAEAPEAGVMPDAGGSPASEEEPRAATEEGGDGTTPAGDEDLASGTPEVSEGEAAPGSATPSAASEAAEALEEDEVPAPPAAIGEGEEALAEQPAARDLIDMDDLGAGQRYGEEGAVRVVLLATADSWIQVRGADGELLFTRVLRPGDTYRVPDQPGLTLLTGNAGGLDIVVEGVRLPQLGPNGAVRRDIPLEPEALRDWTSG